MTEVYRAIAYAVLAALVTVALMSLRFKDDYVGGYSDGYAQREVEGVSP